MYRGFKEYVANAHYSWFSMKGAPPWAFLVERWFYPPPPPPPLLFLGKHYHVLVYMLINRFHIFDKGIEV